MINEQKESHAEKDKTPDSSESSTRTSWPYSVGFFEPQPSSNDLSTPDPERSFTRRASSECENDKGGASVASDLEIINPRQRVFRCGPKLIASPNSRTAGSTPEWSRTSESFRDRSSTSRTPTSKHTSSSLEIFSPFNAPRQISDMEKNDTKPTLTTDRPLLLLHDVPEFVSEGTSSSQLHSSEQNNSNSACERFSPIAEVRADGKPEPISPHIANPLSRLSPNNSTKEASSNREKEEPGVSCCSLM